MNKLPEFGNDPHFCRYKGVRCNAGPGACLANRICCFTIMATEPLKKFQRRPASTIPIIITAWAQPGATMTTMVGPIFTWPTTRGRIFCTTTDMTELSRTSACSAASRLVATVCSRARWVLPGATTFTKAGLSMLVTNFVEQGSMLYHNLGKATALPTSACERRSRSRRIRWQLGNVVLRYGQSTDGWIFSSPVAMSILRWTVSGGAQY